MKTNTDEHIIPYCVLNIYIMEDILFTIVFGNNCRRIHIETYASFVEI